MTPEDRGPLSMRHLVKYPDCNATKNLFGGRMLAWIDEGAAMYAASQMKTDHLVTRLVGQIEFRVPVPLGHVCNIYARTKKEGNTSLTVTVTVTRTTFNGTGTEDVVCETDIVFVALDAKGKPTPWKDVPPARPRRKKNAPPDIHPGQTFLFGDGDHHQSLTTRDRDDNPIPPTCAYCGKVATLCKGIVK